MACFHPGGILPLSFFSAPGLIVTIILVAQIASEAIQQPFRARPQETPRPTDDAMTSAPLILHPHPHSAHVIHEEECTGRTRSGTYVR